MAINILCRGGGIRCVRFCVVCLSRSFIDEVWSIAFLQTSINIYCHFTTISCVITIHENNSLLTIDASDRTSFFVVHKRKAKNDTLAAALVVFLINCHLRRSSHIIVSTTTIFFLHHFDHIVDFISFFVSSSTDTFFNSTVVIFLATAISFFLLFLFAVADCDRRRRSFAFVHFAVFESISFVNTKNMINYQKKNIHDSI